MAFNISEWNKKRDKEEGKSGLHYNKAESEWKEKKNKKPNYGSQVKQAFGFASSISSEGKKSLREKIFGR